MKIFFTLLLSAVSLSALEFRPNYFYATSSDFRTLFSNGGIDYQVSGTLPFPCLKNVNLWLAVDYFSNHSRSNLLRNKIFIRMVPVTVGLRYVCPDVCSLFNAYGALGLKGYFVRTSSNVCCAEKEIDRRGCGGVVEVGVNKTFCRCFSADLFFSYSFKNFSAPNLSNCAVKPMGLNVSGINVGAGVGYQF